MEETFLKLTYSSVGEVMGPSHQGAGGVIEDGHHVHIGHAHSLEGGVQHRDNILTNHSGAVETLKRKYQLTCSRHSQALNLEFDLWRLY